MPLPSVSVIVPAYNSERTIGATLTSLAAQTYRGPLEVILVDDGSSDGTRGIVSSFSQVKYFFQLNAGPATARNLGASHASSDILFFTDADCCPEPQWVEKMLNGFVQDDVAVVAGSYGIANSHSRLSRIIHEEIKFRHDRLMPEFPQAFGSYNFAIRKNIFVAVGGFNTHYRKASGEDNDLSYKIIKSGKRIRFLRDVVVAHYHPENFGKYLKDQYGHGMWRVRMYSDHPHMAGGDGYTFWKDIVEVPAVVVTLVLFITAHGLLALWAMLFLLMLEAFFGFVMVARPVDRLVSGGVFFARAYARTIGFSVGLCKFFIYLIIREKKDKIPLRH